MSLGDKWQVFWESTGTWRPAEIVNELDERVELKFTDGSHEADLQKTLSATREEMKDRSRFR
jgi:hypothetical protein